MLRDDEIYLGPSWDEFGVQFFLIYNKTAKAFLYLLSETPKVDLYEPSSLSPAVTVGNRTSFVFYKDKLLDRKILMGDFIGHTMLNDYFDGPFDQLPDNYVQGNALLDAILEVEPGLKEREGGPLWRRPNRRIPLRHHKLQVLRPYRRLEADRRLRGEKQRSRRLL